MRDFLVVIHLLLLTYWLGGDLGVFYSSRHVLRTEHSPATRAVALKIMGWLDMAPRLCMVLFLASGISLLAVDPLGRHRFGGWRIALVWVLTLGWAALVVGDHHYTGTPLGRRINRLDLVVRCGLVVGLVGVGLYTLVAHDPFGVDTNPKWLGGKLVAYALTVAMGVCIRIKLRPFGPAWVALQSGTQTDDNERVLRRAINGSIPFVALIWVFVVTAAVLGVAKPGVVNH